MYSEATVFKCHFHSKVEEHNSKQIVKRGVHIRSNFQARSVFPLYFLKFLKPGGPKHIFSISLCTEDLKLFIFHIAAEKANCIKVITSGVFRMSGDVYHKRHKVRSGLIEDSSSSLSHNFRQLQKIQKELFSKHVISHDKKYQLSGAGFLFNQVCVKLN